MKYYIIAGEASGDLHASNLMREINRLDARPEYRCWGGDLMAAQGGKIVKHYKDLAFMGFWEVATHLRTILSNISFCKKDILAFNPDLVIFVDYPGFNLRIADFVKKHGYKIVYYISPQIWAWKTGRVHKIKRTCDHVMPILPFEKEFYARYGYSADFVGHPLLDAIDEQQIKKSKRTKKEKPKKEPKEKTWNITFYLYKQGMNPDEIAQNRGLTVATIIGHLARFIPTGEITLSELVPPEHQDAILKVIQTIGKGESKTAIKSLCPPEVTYQEIELVLEAQS